mmetsp:Transcript_29090/g.93777  ORF Transcript_29090/g.93777 Transcript_29090/m.93777 type:complete len:233 (+) Transcript_29090:2796-3494(+)
MHLAGPVVRKRGFPGGGGGDGGVQCHAVPRCAQAGLVRHARRARQVPPGLLLLRPGLGSPAPLDLHPGPAHRAHLPPLGGRGVVWTPRPARLHRPRPLARPGHVRGRVPHRRGGVPVQRGALAVGLALQLRQEGGQGQDRRQGRGAAAAEAEPDQCLRRHTVPRLEDQGARVAPSPLLCRDQLALRRLLQRAGLLRRDQGLQQRERPAAVRSHHAGGRSTARGLRARAHHAV